MIFVIPYQEIGMKLFLTAFTTGAIRKTLKKRLLIISNWADIDLNFARQVLNRFCAPLCDFLRADAPGGADNHLIIDQVERENLFLVHLDNERRWYRYHSDATCLA
jgi:hypothetical protein